jgi:hypothetical protein
MRLIEVSGFERPIHRTRPIGNSEGCERRLESDDSCKQLGTDAEVAGEAAFEPSTRDGEMLREFRNAHPPVVGEQSSSGPRSQVVAARIRRNVSDQPLPDGCDEAGIIIPTFMKAGKQLPDVVGSDQGFKGDLAVGGRRHVEVEDSRYCSGPEPNTERTDPRSRVEFPWAGKRTGQEHRRLPPPASVDQSRETVAEVHDDFRACVWNDVLGRTRSTGPGIVNQPKALDESA